MSEWHRIEIVVGSYLLIIFLGSALPINSALSPLNNNYTLSIRWDYLLHVLVYLPLAWLIGRWMVRRYGSENWVILILITLVIPPLFELLQLLLPYRAFNINDLVANGVGAMVGLLLVLILRKRLSPV